MAQVSRWLATEKLEANPGWLSETGHQVVAVVGAGLLNLDVIDDPEANDWGIDLNPLVPIVRSVGRLLGGRPVR